jgi:hypothetical protein
MAVRTTNKTVTFHGPFCLKGVDRLLPPADYRVMTDEELIEGLSFSAYRRISTAALTGSPAASVSFESVPTSRAWAERRLNCFCQ